MFRNIYLAIACFALSTSMHAQDITLTVDSVPQSIPEFLELRGKLAKTPEGGAIIILKALQMHAQDKKLGLQAITIALAKKNLTKGKIYRGYQPHGSLNYHLSRMEKIPYAPFAYILGANPANQYQVKAPYRYKISRNKYSGKESESKVKVFIHVHGHSPRPVKLTVNDKGLWKAAELSSLFLNVQPPQEPDLDDL